MSHELQNSTELAWYATSRSGRVSRPFLISQKNCPEN
jgi:hypothetical protein